MLKAVIFDMDGLMIDSERICFRGYQKEFEKYEKIMDETLYQLILGKNKPSIYQAFHEVMGENFPIEKIHEDVLEYIDATLKQEGVPLKEGLLELLEYLQTKKIKCVVATSSNRNRVNFILRHAGIEKYFDAVICGDEVTCGKPNPEIFLKGCAKVDATSDEVIVLEDSEMGIKAAFDGNMKVICVPDMKYPEKQYVEKTWCILENLFEVKTFLEENVK